MTTDPKDKKDQPEVDKETLKDLEAKDAEDVKGGASGWGDCKPIHENIDVSGTPHIDAGG